MNQKIVKLSTVTLTLMMILSSIMVFHVTAQNGPTIFIDPALNSFSTDTTSVGKTFDVAVKAADFGEPGVYSYELKLRYDNTMLEATAASIPDGHWLTPSSPANIFKVDPGTIDQAGGFASFAVTLLGAEEGKTGGGTIVVVTLKITAAPEVGKELTSEIYLNPDEIILVDPSANQIPSANYDLVPSEFVYASPPPPEPYLTVSSKSWDVQGANAAGGLFNITVTINDLLAEWHAVGFQFKLGFDNSLLETKNEWVFEGGFAKQFGETFFVAFVEQTVIVGQLVLPEWPDPAELDKWMHGSGTIATIQFNATYRPPPDASSELGLSEVQIVDYQSNIIPYSRLENGLYSITVAPPPWLAVDPQTTEIANLGDSFDLNVIAKGLVKGFRLVGVEFQVHYNTSVLETTAEDITEGELMMDFAQRAGTSTFFQAYVEDEHGLIGIIILPLPDGTWPEEVFPDRDGVLATLKFTAIMQLDNDDIITEVTAADVLLVNADAKEIPIDETKLAEQGTCVVTILKAVVPPTGPPQHPDYPYSIDLYTQYVSPYGGQGYNRPSDAFPPQAEILLNAEATYFGDAVVGKPVVFTINGPGGVQYSTVVGTNEQGVALLSYIVPWAKESFGLWTAQASWQIGTRVIADTMKFRVGYLVEVESMSLTPAEGEQNDARYNAIYPVYYKGKTYNLNMELTAITMQSPGVCMAKLMGIQPAAVTAVSIFDELGQPVAYTAVSAPALYGPALPYDEQFVLQQETQSYLVGPLAVTIGPNAFSGRASVQANVLTATSGGFAFCEPTIGYIWIWSKNRTSGPTQEEQPAIWLEVGDGSVKYNQVVSIPVIIHDVDPSAKIVGIQFRITFDSSVLQATEVIEGTFVAQFGETFFTAYIENGVLVGELQLPPYPGANGWMTGTGLLCTIKFKALYHAPPPTGTVLSLSDAFMVNYKSEVVKFISLDKGYVQVVG